MQMWQALTPGLDLFSAEFTKCVEKYLQDVEKRLAQVPLLSA